MEGDCLNILKRIMHANYRADVLAPKTESRIPTSPRHCEYFMLCDYDKSGLSGKQCNDGGGSGQGLGYSAIPCLGPGYYTAEHVNSKHISLLQTYLWSGVIPNIESNSTHQTTDTSITPLKVPAVTRPCNLEMHNNWAKHDTKLPQNTRPTHFVKTRGTSLAQFGKRVTADPHQRPKWLFTPDTRKTGAR